jgi:hypothetical protein
MAHVLQNSVGDGGKGYGWWSEAHAEGLASYYMVVRVYQAGQWQRYGWVQDFWDLRLYHRDPWVCEAPNRCAYQYGAFFAWLAWRYSPLNATLTYALPHDGLRKAYWNFLLSPWSWGRDPVYYEYDECIGKSVETNSALYCVYRPILPNRTYVFSSSLLINATGLEDRILLALVASRASTADPSVTVSYCPECKPTATVTTTQTVTTTVTRTETYTVTYTTTETYTVTIPTTTTVTYTTTVTVPVTTTVTETETYTTTVPVTTTVTVPVATTVTYTTTVTVPTTVTSTTTDVVTKTETVTTTVTVTATATNQESCMWCWYVVAILAVLVAVCLMRCRNTALNSRKRLNNYGSTVYI